VALLQRMYEQKVAAHPINKDKVGRRPRKSIDAVSPTSNGGGGGGWSAGGTGAWKPLFSPAASRSSLLTGTTDPMTRGNSILTRDPSTNGITFPNSNNIVPLSHMPTIPSGREEDWAAAMDKLATHEQTDATGAGAGAGTVARSGSGLAVENLLASQRDDAAHDA
jgi:hypothetical protein